MKRLVFLLIIAALGINHCFAKTWSCSRQYSASMGNEYVLPNVNVTLNRNIPDNTVLYTYKRVTPGIQQVGCVSTQLEWYLSFQDVGAKVYEGTLDGASVAIYATNIPGIGISINDADGGGGTIAMGRTVKKYPDVLDKYMNTSNNLMGMWLDIRIWKIAGDIPATSGALQFTGPTVYQGLIPKSSVDSFSDTTMSLNPGKWWTANYSYLKGSLTFINSTCDIQGGDKTVNLGKFDGSSGGALWRSAWKDASFKLDCPMAYGFGGRSGDGGYTSAGIGGNPAVQQTNQVLNNPVTIKILPLTEVVAQDYFGNVIDGILAFAGSSAAKGYGVQLAWGDAATLGTGNPAKPVVFNTPILANGLNSAYRATSYALNSRAISTTADGTFKMAARFIRTSGEIEPGPAKAAIEILASYD